MENDKQDRALQALMFHPQWENGMCLADLELAQSLGIKPPSKGGNGRGFHRAEFLIELAKHGRLWAWRMLEHNGLAAGIPKPRKVDRRTLDNFKLVKWVAVLCDQGGMNPYCSSREGEGAIAFVARGMGIEEVRIEKAWRKAINRAKADAPLYERLAADGPMELLGKVLKLVPIER